MSTQEITTSDSARNSLNGSLLLGAGLALASFIILPAVAARLGWGSSLTGAMRIALMKASAKASNKNASAEACTTSFSCH